MSNFVSVAKITRTRGIRGEVSAEILTDFPERFSSLGVVRVASENFESFEEIENFWFQKTKVILKFKGRNRPHEVDELVGKEVQIPENERIDLPEDTYFDSDLEGCSVYENQKRLGEVVRVEKGSEDNPNLVVQSDEENEFMIPVVKQFIKIVEIKTGSIHVDLPPGLIELTITKTKPGKKKK